MTRQAMERERWKEVKKDSPCEICGKGDWCRRSPDGTRIACRREARGAVKVKRYEDGSEAYIHDLQPGRPQDNGTPKRRRPASRGGRTTTTTTGIANEAPTGDGTPAAADGLTDAEAELRNTAYRMLLAELPLSPEHRQNLRRRGLTDEQIDAGGYRTWPGDRKARMHVAAKLFHALGNETFVRIPGLGPGASEIHAAPGSLLIPVRDVAGRIIALVVRPDDPGDGGKYRWLSSRSERNPDGPSPGSPAHVPQEVRGPVDLALLVEGILKGDVVFRLCGIPVVAIGGASQWRNAIPILRALGVRTVRLAFDMDCLTNRLVARALVECFGGLQAEGFAVELARWNPEHKGLDDFLLAANGTPEVLPGPAALTAVEQIAKAAVADEPAAPAAGGDSDEKKSQSTLLVELAQRAELWHAPGDGDAYASVRFATDDCGGDDDAADDDAADDCGGDDDDIDAGDEPGDGGPVAHWPVRSKAFRRWLARKFFLKHGKAPGSQALQDALNVVEGQAAFAGQERPVFVRVAGHDGRLYLDLANPAWQAVEIDADGWRVVESEACPVRFRRAKAMMPLPTPTAGGDIGELRWFVNVDADGWPLLLGWLAAALNPSGPYPVLALHGEQGSAKTCTGLAVQRIIDPNAGGLRSEPREPRDLMIAAANCWVVAYDNLSHIEPWLSDALCRLATGGGFATRTLYSDDEETIFYAKRPIILTGIEELATRSDLLDRCVIVQLPRIPDERRITEADFLRAFDAAAPGILGAVLDAVSAAVRNLPTTRIERLPRMADFALWATAAESGLGLRPGEFLAAYAENRQAANETALESSPVAKHILTLADAGGWAGTPSELHAKLETLATDQEKHAKSWPKTARPLSGILKRLAPNLRAAGAEVEFRHEGWGKTKRRTIEISAYRDAKQADRDATGTQTAHRVDTVKDGNGTQGTQGTQDSTLHLGRGERCKVTI